MKYSLLLLTLVALGLSGCAGLTGPVIMGGDAVGIYATKPATPPPADTADQIAPHESWCYQTMGDSQCFAHAQDVPPERLINVDPQNKYPVDLPAYRQAIAGKPAMVVTTQTTVVVEPAVQPVAAAVQPVAAPPVAVAPVAAAPPEAGQPVSLQPLSLQPGVDVQSEKETLKDEMDDDDAPEVAAPAPDARH